MKIKKEMQEKKETRVWINLEVETRKQSDLGIQSWINNKSQSQENCPDQTCLKCTRENSPNQQPYLPKYTQDPT